MFYLNIQGADTKEKKTAENKKKKKGSLVDDDDLDLESLDWWSKYFASVDTLIMVRYPRNLVAKTSWGVGLGVGISDV